MSTVWNTQPSTASALRTAGNVGNINVKDYPYLALGDGATDDTAAVTSAVAAAYAAGDELYWPVGTYLTTASIQNFHDVRHRGSGVVKRGSTLFYVEPRDGQTNNLYVSATGSASNDGLSSSEPMATVQAAGNVIYGYPYGDVTWKVHLGAGTYTEAATFSKAFPTPNRVQFLGPAVADGTVPTANMNSPGGSGKTGLYFQNGARAYVEDIKFTDYRDGASVSISGASSGITADGNCELYTRNIHASGCDMGVEIAFLSQLRLQAGIIQSCGLGVKAISNASYTIGYNGTAADITGTTGTAIFSNVAGVLAQEGAFGHLDYCYVGSNATGMEITANARCHAQGCTFASNTLAVEIEANGTFYDNPITTNTYTSNTNDIRTRSGGRRAGALEESNSYGPGVKEIDTATTSTQSATPVTVYTKAFAANELAIRNAGFKLRIHGEVSGTAGTKNVTVALGATTILNRTITASTLEYYIELDFYNRTAASSQKYNSRVYENGVAPVIVTGTAAEDLTAAKTLTITHHVDNTADRNDIELVELEITH